MNKTTTTPILISREVVSKNIPNSNLLSDVNINNMVLTLRAVENALGAAKAVREENTALLSESKLLQECIYDLMMGYTPAAMGTEKIAVLEAISKVNQQSVLADGRTISAYEYYLSNVKLECLQTSYIQQFDAYNSKVTAEKNALLEEIENRDIIIRRLEKELADKSLTTFVTPTKAPSLMTPEIKTTSAADTTFLSTPSPLIKSESLVDMNGAVNHDKFATSTSSAFTPYTEGARTGSYTEGVRPVPYTGIGVTPISPLTGSTSVGNSPVSSLLGSISHDTTTNGDTVVIPDRVQSSPYKGIGVASPTSDPVVATTVNVAIPVNPAPARFDKKALEGKSYTIDTNGYAVFASGNPDDILRLCTSSDISKITEDQKKTTLRANGVIIKGFNE